MRILHIENIAGVPARLARTQNELGHVAHVLETWRRPGSKIVFPHDFENYYEGASIPIKMLRTVLMARKYDIVHLHGGIARKRVDIPAIKRLWKIPLVVHFHGSETRMGYGLHRQHLIDAKIVATPDLLEYHPNAHYIPNSIDLMDLQPKGGTKIIHIASNPELKGTERIRRALNGLDVDAAFHTNISHDEALGLIAESDILIDELPPSPIRGRVNLIALEAMAMGKTVISALDPELAEYYPYCPIIPARNEEELRAVVKELIENPQTIIETGLAGQKYVAASHDPVKVTREIIGIYEEIMR